MIIIIINQFHFACLFLFKKKYNLFIHLFDLVLFIIITIMISIYKTISRIIAFSPPWILVSAISIIVEIKKKMMSRAESVP